MNIRHYPKVLLLVALTTGCEASVRHYYAFKTVSSSLKDGVSVEVQPTTLINPEAFKYRPFIGFTVDPGATGFIVLFKSSDRPKWVGIVNLSVSYKYEDGPVRKARVASALYGSREWENDIFAAYVLPESNLLRKKGAVSRVIEPGTYELILEYDIALKRHRETVTVEYSDTGRVEFEWFRLKI